ncbi:MAG: KAP family NTPase [Chloroflexi bacterium]|nr:KAP family NTPase [Chloroflexota bacterium]
MRHFHSSVGKHNIHEPLTPTPECPEGIFQRDILDRHRLAERILNRLTEEDCPYALGIYGGWGTGKTSLLNLMKQLNERAPGGIPNSVCMVAIDA